MTAAPIIGITKTYLSIKMLNIENRKSLKMFIGDTGIGKLQILITLNSDCIHLTSILNSCRYNLIFHIEIQSNKRTLKITKKLPIQKLQ